MYKQQKGEKKIYRIVDSEREELDEDKWGIFYSNECYLISYTYSTPKGKPESYIYYWLGNSAGPGKVFVRKSGLAVKGPNSKRPKNRYFIFFSQ